MKVVLWLFVGVLLQNRLGKASTVSNCSVTVDNRDWTVAASCDIERAFTSDGLYSCRWFVPDGNKVKSTAQEHGSFELISFNGSHQTYTRGKCTISGMPMPTANGIYHYNVIMEPGTVHFVGPSLEIKQPGNPTLSNCPNTVREGDDVTCTCLPSVSSPPALTTWYTGTANYNNVLQLGNVSKSLAGIHYTCTQYWGGLWNEFRKRTTYSVCVSSLMSPPCKPQIEENTAVSNNDDDEVHWIQLPFIIGGVVGALVVTIVAIVVVVVVVVRKRRGDDPMYAKPTRRSQLVDSNIYTDLAPRSSSVSTLADKFSVYELPTRRSQVVDTNIYTDLCPQ